MNDQSRPVLLDPAAVITGCGLFVAVLFLTPILNDGDTLWQIRTGQWILGHRAIPATDPFSFTAGGRPWFAHEWLAETLMALAYACGEIRGIMALSAAAVGLTGAVIVATARRHLPGLYAVIALALALSNAAGSMLARPHLLAWPCLALWCAGLANARTRGTAPSFWLLPVMLLWVNLHGSFMVGLLLPGALMIEALLDPTADRRRAFLAWSLFILAAWAVALCNPDFIAGTLFPFRMVRMHSLAWIGEWEPTDFSHGQPVELVILAAILLGALGLFRLPPMRLLLLLGLIHAALAHARNGQLLGLVGALMLVEPMGRLLGRGKAEALGRPWPLAAVGAVVVALAALGLRAATPFEPPGGASFAAVLDQVPPAVRERPVFNEYGVGGTLIFHGVRPFIDSRADLYGDAFLTRYRLASWPDRAALDRLLAEYQIAWTIFPAGHPILTTMDTEPGWRRLPDVDGYVVHIRDGGAG
jgi:hypothetical protein